MGKFAKWVLSSKHDESVLSTHDLGRIPQKFGRDVVLFCIIEQQVLLHVQILVLLESQRM